MVQGLTEFFPISSSGHLVFFQSLFGLEEPQVAFDVMLHLGTLFAVVAYLRADILRIVQQTAAWAKGRREGQDEAKLFLWVIVATLPTGLMGALLKDWFESFFSRPHTVGWMLLATGVILWLTRYATRNVKTAETMGLLDALLIGVGQGVAIIPGISRSGTTMAVGLFRRLNRELAGKFSFLLSIPAILGAAALKLPDMELGPAAGMSLAGAAAAFVVGFFSLKLLMRVITAGKLSRFAYYCWAIGLWMVILTK